jgi:DNA-binding beta-propeller fold protein YncE
MTARISGEHSASLILLRAAFILTLICAGCGSPRGELFPALERPLVWPEPPEAARIKYVGTISSETDLKKEVSWTQGVGKLIFGKKEPGVLVNPYAVAVDRGNRLLVADTGTALVHLFDLKTRNYTQLVNLPGKEKLRMPVALAVAEGNVYVVDSLLHEVCVFDLKGKFLFAFGAQRLKRPSGIACSPDEQLLYVVDTAQHVVNVFGKGGEFLRNIGARGSEPGRFNFPTHLWTDQSGQLYVSDTLNYRVQVFTGEGVFVKVFGRQGDRPGNFGHPCGLATDSFGHIYVTDRQFENVQIFDNDGRILMAFGEEGASLGRFWLPGGICVDHRNRIYVADSFNNRVQVFELLEGVQP